MKDKLLVGVMGNPKSGKSFTWNELFGRVVQAGKYSRDLYLTKDEYVKVFLVSGSPEERGIYVGDIIKDNNARIVLCSMQYPDAKNDTIDYFVNNGYFLFIHWLNPGFKDKGVKIDDQELVSDILKNESMFGIRSGEKEFIDSRVNEIKDFIYGWAKSRDLINKS